MTPEFELALREQMLSVLTGASPDDYAWPDDKEAYAWRMIRWGCALPIRKS